MSDRLKTGDATRRRTLGAAHVERSQKGRDGFNAPFLDLLTEAAWGTVWASDTGQPARTLDDNGGAAGRAWQP